MEQLEIIKNRFYTEIEELNRLIDKMPDKGNTCEESQRLCLQQSLNEFEHTVNGIEAKDLKEDE